MTMKPRDIKRLEKCVAYYGMIAGLLDKCADSIDPDDKFWQAVVSQMQDEARADKAYLGGKLDALKKGWV